jgi:hypothetical protein
MSSARASAKCPFAERGGSPAKKAITACGSTPPCQRAASARRRSTESPGQLGLVAMKALYREKSLDPSSLRKTIHSTTFRANGSVMELSTLVASSCRFLRTRSIACFTAERSSGEVAAVAAGAKGGAIRGVGFACTAGAGEGTFVGAAETGTVSAGGASVSGAPWDVVDFRAVGFGAAGLLDLTALFDGRCAGSGTGSDGHAGCTWAVMTPSTKAAATMGLKAFTFPPRAGFCLNVESYARGEVE